MPLQRPQSLYSSQIGPRHRQVLSWARKPRVMRACLADERVTWGLGRWGSEEFDAAELVSYIAYYDTS